MELYTCKDCGNTDDFRVLYHDWSLLTKGEDGEYTITDSLSFGEADNPKYPMECHDCGGTNVKREDV